MFTLEGKQYTSEIIVSMQAKINPVVSSVKQNLSDLIKNIDLGNIFDNNDNTIFTAVNQKNHNIIDDFSQIEITIKIITLQL
uniref:SARP2 n=1 Tax=Spiroplasma citri TaxID=2133 RepID=Q4QYW8_SPICI|nr:SARP2 [Spiroplasma citri]